MLNGKKYLGVDSNGHKGLVNYYNWHCSPLVSQSRRYKMKLVDDWCAMFVSVLAHEAGYLKEDFPYEVSVYYMTEIARSRGQYSHGSVGTIRKGDLIVYDWTGRGTFDHVGVVVSAGAEFLEVIEGNYNKTVGIRTIRKSSKSIRGFITLGSGGISVESMRLGALVVQVMKGQLGNGQDRQEALGSDYGEVQAMVNRMI